MSTLFGLAQGLQNSIGNPYIAGLGSVPAGGWQTLGQTNSQVSLASSQVSLAPPRVTMDVLKNHAAFTEPLSTIENMWRVKYGTEWVSEKDVYYGGDEFYVLAMHRLSQSSRLERFMLSDTYDYVVRLPE